MAGKLRRRLTFSSYRCASFLVQALPEPTAYRLASIAAVVAAYQSPFRRRLVERNLNRVYLSQASLAAHNDRAVDVGNCGDQYHGARLATRRDIDAVFASYAQYWVESFRIPLLSRSRLDAQMTVSGIEHLDAALSKGKGAILALPHLGGWDFGGAWFASAGYKPTVVVEDLDPPELLEWFSERRSKMGLTVVPNGPKAFPVLAKALKRGEVVGLVSDRDLSGNGVKVDFFGEETSLPAGAATLAIRTGASILPAAVFRCPGGGHRAVILSPLITPTKDRLSNKVALLTESMGQKLEMLISLAPHQWHLLQPNWPDDRPG